MRGYFTIFIFLFFTGLSSHAEQASKASPWEFQSADTSILSSIGDAFDKVLEAEASLIEWLSPLAFKYAMKLDLPVEELSNFHLLSFIDKWMGVRYKMGGETMSGIDCSAFTRKLLQDVYSITVGRVVPEQFKAGAEVSREDLKMGDLVFFKISNRRNDLTHVGFYLGNDRFVHATVHKGVVIDNLNDPYYNKSFRSGIRVKF